LAQDLEKIRTFCNKDISFYGTRYLQRHTVFFPSVGRGLWA